MNELTDTPVLFMITGKGVEWDEFKTVAIYTGNRQRGQYHSSSP